MTGKRIRRALFGFGCALMVGVFWYEAGHQSALFLLGAFCMAAAVLPVGDL